MAHNTKKLRRSLSFFDKEIIVFTTPRCSRFGYFAHLMARRGTAVCRRRWAKCPLRKEFVTNNKWIQSTYIIVLALCVGLSKVFGQDSFDIQEYKKAKQDTARIHIQCKEPPQVRSSEIKIDFTEKQMKEVFVFYLRTETAWRSQQ